VSREVVEAVGLDDVAFSDVGPVELKGVTHPVSLFAARHLE
jgi:class 3 adenylate cyclase